MIEAHPLHWPAGWPRNQYPEYSKFKTSLATARDGVTREIQLLGGSNVVISSNAVLLRNGDIAARQPRIENTGVAVYFDLNGKQQCIPCDRWMRIEENLRAIELTVNALRGLERWGAKEIVAAAFQGFQALPAGTPGGSWWQTLEVQPNASELEIESAYRKLAKQHHPDVGGDPMTFHRINEAYRQAKSARRTG